MLFRKPKLLPFAILVVADAIVSKRDIVSHVLRRALLALLSCTRGDRREPVVLGLRGIRRGAFIVLLLSAGGRRILYPNLGRILLLKTDHLFILLIDKY